MSRFAGRCAGGRAGAHQRLQHRPAWKGFSEYPSPSALSRKQLLSVSLRERFSCPYIHSLPRKHSSLSCFLHWRLYTLYSRTKAKSWTCSRSLANYQCQCQTLEGSNFLWAHKHLLVLIIPFCISKMPGILLKLQSLLIFNAWASLSSCCPTWKQSDSLLGQCLFWVWMAWSYQKMVSGSK